MDEKTAREIYQRWSGFTNITTDQDPSLINNTFETFSFPIIKNVQVTLAGGGWVKSKKQQLKEDRLNKLRKLIGQEPNIVLPKDKYIEGIIPVQPLSAPTTNLMYLDFNYLIVNFWIKF